MHNSERGAALIVVLGLVAIVAAWAATAAYEDMLSMRRASNQQDSAAAEMACISALRLARLTLEEDGKSSSSDDLEEVWALPPTPFPLDNGVVMGEIVDSNRYLNLNDLVNDQGVVDVYSYPVMERLFSQLELDASLLPALVDWMDADDRTASSGMEVTTYDYVDYEIKNARLDRWRELTMIPGFTDEVLTLLKPFVTVRPAYAGVRTMININTADKLLLQAIFPQLTDAEADAFILARPYSDLSGIQGKSWATGSIANQLTVNSDMFFIHTQASFAHINRYEDYLIARQGGNIQLLWREWKVWQP